MSIRVALIQFNPIIGAVSDNCRRMLQRVDEAQAAGVHLIIFPELVTLGYPPRDLLQLDDLLRGNQQTLFDLAAATAGRQTAIIVGHVSSNEGAWGRALFNSASLLADGKVVQRWDKTLLPTYDVFDEARYFQPSFEPSKAIEFRGRRLGVTICEDVWTHINEGGKPIYMRNPLEELLADGCDLLVNLSASPYEMNKLKTRREIAARLAIEHHLPILCCNQVGGADELVFDGGSFVVDARGNLVAQAPQFEESLLVTELNSKEKEALEPPEEGLEAVRAALEFGLVDYMRKCGFRDAVVGLSGGIDSAVTCTLAAEALGAEHVVGLLMPSPHSSNHSVEDARTLAENLGVGYEILRIDEMMAASERTLATVFEGLSADVTEENIQARIRGQLLMAYSNKFGHLLLSTGNKTELAVGYCTLYGDMAGGLALISDLPKMMVYALGRLLNANGEVIPARVFTKPPSAELRPDQKDEDSLPPYPVLDAIVAAYVEEFLSVDEIVDAGYERELVEHVVKLIHQNEYKRRQAAPGIRVTSKAFGSGRRLPIAHRRR